MALVQCLHWPSQDVVLLHVMLDRHSVIVESLLRTDELIPQVKELLKALASQHEVLALITVDAQDSISAPNVFDEQWEHSVDFIFDWSHDIQLQIDHGDVRQSALICDSLNYGILFDFQGCKTAQVSKQADCAFEVNVNIVGFPSVSKHVQVLGVDAIAQLLRLLINEAFCATFTAPATTSVAPAVATTAATTASLSSFSSHFVF